MLLTIRNKALGELLVEQHGFDVTFMILITLFNLTGLSDYNASGSIQRRNLIHRLPTFSWLTRVTATSTSALGINCLYMGNWL